MFFPSQEYICTKELMSKFTRRMKDTLILANQTIQTSDIVLGFESDLTWRSNKKNVLGNIFCLNYERKNIINTPPPPQKYKE